VYTCLQRRQLRGSIDWEDTASEERHADPEVEAVQAATRHKVNESLTIEEDASNKVTESWRDYWSMVDELLFYEDGDRA
jgi:hypothetical protein